MKLWIRTHRAVILFLVAAGTVWVCALAAGATIALPSLQSSDFFTNVPLYVVFPLLPVVFLGHSIESGESQILAVATRPVRSLNVALAMATITISIVSAALAGWLVGWDLGLHYLRGFAALAGLLLISRLALASRSAALVPASYSAIAVLLGRRPDGSTEAWAWVVDSQLLPVHLWLSGALFALGLLATGMLSSARLMGR